MNLPARTVNTSLSTPTITSDSTPTGFGLLFETFILNGPMTWKKISGGGIGGLMLAIALAPYKDIEINIYEGTSKFEKIGADLAIWDAAVQAFKKLGIEEQLSTIAPGHEDKSSFELRRSNQPEGEQYGTLELWDSTVPRSWMFSSRFFNKENTTGKIYFGKRCIKYEYDQNTGRKDVENHFKDSTTATCDVLVGSDEIRSVIRKQLVDETAKDKGWSAQDSAVDSSGLRFSGTVAYRALVDSTSIPEHPARKLRKAYIVTYPVAGSKFINLVAYVSDPGRHDEWMNGPWTTDVDRNEVMEEYSDFEYEVQVMLSTRFLDGHSLFEVDPLLAWSDGPVTMLAHLLGLPDVTPNNIPSLLRSYEFIRKPRSEKTLQCTREAKRVLEFMGEYAIASNEYINKTFDELVLWLWGRRAGFRRRSREGEKGV
ncbi:hypothetical protein Clacol_008011 [Clathrus columnatus]|uniref:Uncharacterized protein n=1 Tax=Clathrus columnatus TaxID=1419009 RepID=A0AAV5AHC5_9AGAM|nr:hypothetical protein Clacol_008011 [Clathrus columnatus]